MCLTSFPKLQDSVPTGVCEACDRLGPSLSPWGMEAQSEVLCAWFAIRRGRAQSHHWGRPPGTSCSPRGPMGLHPSGTPLHGRSRPCRAAPPPPRLCCLSFFSAVSRPCSVLPLLVETCTWCRSRGPEGAPGTPNLSPTWREHRWPGCSVS